MVRPKWQHTLPPPGPRSEKQTSEKVAAAVLPASLSAHGPEAAKTESATAIATRALQANPELEVSSEAALRIANIAPTARDAAQVLTAKYTSAAQIASVRFDEFAKALPDVQNDVAQTIHDNAVAVTQRNEMALAAVAPSLSGDVTPVMIGLTGSAAKDAVNLETLFDDATSANCDHCCSVLSPSAYLVDLLEFLNGPVGSELLRRRPDIAELELSCANTNTEIPYIDLVNEVLESFLAHKRGEQPPHRPSVQVYNHRDGVDGPEVLAEPQNIHDDAYELLKRDITPIGILPFDRHLEQSRILLTKLGSSREEVLRIFGAPDETALPRALAAECLGLTETEYLALTGQSFSADKASSKARGVHEYWGFASEADMLSNYHGACRVKTQFLPRTGYTYDQFIELLQTEYINGPPIPRELLQVESRLEELWNLVDWTRDNKDVDGKYGRLLAALTGGRGYDGSQKSSDLLAGFIRLPNLITVMLVSDEPAPTGGVLKDPNAYWSLTGSIVYGTKEEAEVAEEDGGPALGPVGRIDGDGIIWTARGPQTQLGYIDERGQFLNTQHTPFYSQEEFADPSKFFWFKNPHIGDGILGQLLRNGNTNGELRIFAHLDSPFQALGPTSLSIVAGWAWKPLKRDGEPPPSLMTIRQLSGQPLPVSQWRRINNFVRLQKCMGWTIAETDMVLRAFKVTRISPAVLERLAFIRSLQKTARLSLAQVLVFVDVIPLSLYKTLFLKPGVLRSHALFGLSDEGKPLFESVGAGAGAEEEASTDDEDDEDEEEDTEEERDPVVLENICAPIGAAFGLPPTDVMGILVTTGLSSAPLSLQTLSTVYRYVLLCRAVNQPVSRLPSLLSVFGRSPLRDLETLEDFIKLWAGLGGYPATAPADWEYIFQGADGMGRLAPGADLVIRTAVALKLAGALPTQQGTPVGSASGVSEAESRVQILAGVFDKMSSEVISLLVKQLQVPPSAISTGATAGFFIPPFSGRYRLFSPPQKLAQAADSGDVEAHPLNVPIALGETVSLTGGRAYEVQFPSLQGLWVATFIGSAEVDTWSEGAIPESQLVSMEEYQVVKFVMTMLSRYSHLLAKARIPQEDAECVFGYSQLPASGGLAVDGIRKFMAYDGLRQRCYEAQALTAILRHGTYADARTAATAISTATGWDPTLVAGLAAGFASAVPLSDWDLDRPVQVTLAGLDRIRRGYDLAAKIGLSDALRLFSWARDGALGNSDSQMAAELRDVARSQVDQETWDSKARALFDPLRSACRVALVAACLELVPEAGRSADGLFEHFLIDVSMGTCLATSRIKQAISSIQIFVQRCLLGLEKQYGIEAWMIGKQAWAWMSSYDLWQANRRILLFPENWLEPTLRDDKSSAFKTVEAAVGQGSLRLDEAVEAYVAAMHDVSDLEPVSLKAGSSKDHVFARTRSAPHKFFYRTYTRRTGCWSPWEAMDLDIPTVQITRTWTDPPNFLLNFGWDMMTPSGRSTEHISKAMEDHPSRPLASGSYMRLAPVGDSDDRMILFLPVITTRSYKKASDPSVTKYYWEVAMSYSQRQNGKWLPRQTATEVISTHVSSDEDDRGPGQVWKDERFPVPRLRDAPNDQHLVREGSFMFIDYVDSRGRPLIWVYLAVPTMPKMGEGTDVVEMMTRLNEAAIMAAFVGEFIFIDGQLRVGSTRKSMEANFPIFPGLGNFDLLFDGQTVTSEAQRERRLWFTRERPWEMDNTQLRTIDTTPLKKELKREKFEEDDSWAQRCLWEKSTFVCPTPYFYTVPAMLLSNNFTSDFQALVARGEHRDVFEYFNKTTSWVPLPGSAASTTVRHQGLGISRVLGQGETEGETGFQQHWYHELRTPTALYNWELCVHLPMLLASSYAATQQLDEALDALRLVFDPTVPGSAGQDGDDRTQVWRFFPFREAAQKGLMRASMQVEYERQEMLGQAFNPFVIARQRPLAYMRWFAYKYIEVMLAKGDVYFRRFTLESISLAIQCYVEASEVFGPRPQTVRQAGRRAVQTYNAVLRSSHGWNGGTGDGAAAGGMHNALVSMETLFPFRLESSDDVPSVGGRPRVNIFGTSAANYFCVPANPALTRLRASTDDRLHKIRSCQDIDGNVRRLALWEPPLDPGALLRGLAAGAPLGSLVDRASRAAVNYRFGHLIKMAVALCGEVQSLGARILKLRRRKDIELLEVLRTSQLRAVTDRMRDIADQEIIEAEKGLEVIEGNIVAASKRMELYLRLLGEDISKVPTSDQYTEIEYTLEGRVSHGGHSMSKTQRDVINLTMSNIVLKQAVPTLKAAAHYATAIPNMLFTVGVPGNTTTYVTGGQHISKFLERGAKVFKAVAEIPKDVADYKALWAAAASETIENQLQANTAGQDISGYYVEHAAQKALITRAKLRRHLRDEQLAQSDEMDRFLRTKYTSADLYTWTVNSLQKVYYETYHQALDVAAQAERALRFERGEADDASATPIISGGTWNSSYDGLLAGENLAAALGRLQGLHVASRAHDFEITRTVSLRQVAPGALLRLKASPTADTKPFDLPETLWDADFPGHYARRIRSVRVRIISPAGAAPSNATLTLLAHRFRITGDTSGDAYPEADADDPRFFSHAVPIRSVAVGSAATVSAGVFALDFNDERYMPFEGAGLISRWSLSLNSHFPSFDYSTIADVQLEIQYTSRAGSTQLAEQAVASVRAHLETASALSLDHGLAVVLDPRAELPSAWDGFRSSGKLTIPDSSFRSALPYFAAAGSTATVTRVRLVATFTAIQSANKLSVKLAANGHQGINFSILPPRTGDDRLTAASEMDVSAMNIQWERSTADKGWTWELTATPAIATALKSLVLIVGYSLE